MSDVQLTQLAVPIPQDVREPFEKPPQGILEWKIDGLRARMTDPPEGSQSIPKLALEVDMTCTGPDQAAGITWNETFWIGTDDDPHAANAETWKTEAARFVQFCERAGFDPRGATPQQIGGWLTGRTILCDCQHFYMNDRTRDGRPNPKAFTQSGERKSRARMRWIGEGGATPGLYDDQEPKGGGGQGGGQPAQPTPAAPAATAPPPAGAPMGYAPPPMPAAAPMPQPAPHPASQPLPSAPVGAPPGYPGAAPPPPKKR